jgi:hypothetical protein
MKKKSLKPPQLSEHNIQCQILTYLEARGIYHWRNNVGRKHNLYFGKKGSGDILGLTKHGIFFSVEVKNKTYKQSEAQIEFQRMIEQNNGLYILARSLEDVVDKLKA